MTDVWKPCRNWKFWQLVGPIEAFVCIVPDPRGQGFLWQCEKRYGFADTLTDATRWAEALAEHYSIPPSKRWMTL
jgi:hypothetical protein